MQQMICKLQCIRFVYSDHCVLAQNKESLCDSLRADARKHKKIKIPLRISHILSGGFLIYKKLKFLIYQKKTTTKVVFLTKITLINDK